ncbi:hypothetical protein SeLEV6574_g03164 [Synchytrium endobioticum]|uniref:Uncharacterized protein n=1 Tax=Synchytrium endobioticum TaxID=286115 RepID=A0A507D5H4_9FUNG|nr:hypothetical protein SeLEV6574_g03164 [Synchytrium endobioticum]
MLTLRQTVVELIIMVMLMSSNVLLSPVPMGACFSSTRGSAEVVAPDYPNDVVAAHYHNNDDRTDSSDDLRGVNIPFSDGETDGPEDYFSPSSDPVVSTEVSSDVVSTEVSSDVADYSSDEVFLIHA